MSPVSPCWRNVVPLFVVYVVPLITLSARLGARLRNQCGRRHPARRSATIQTRKPSPTGEKFLAAFANCDTIVHDGRPCVVAEDWKRECQRLGLIDGQAKEHSARTLFARLRNAAGACE
jgi:hypothetical protein